MTRKQYLQEDLNKMSDEIKEMKTMYGITEGNQVHNWWNIHLEKFFIYEVIT